MALSYESLLKLGCWCHYSILQPMPRIFTHPTYLPTHPPTHHTKPSKPATSRATKGTLTSDKGPVTTGGVFARAPGESHSRLHFAHSTRTMSAEGCAGTRRIALSPAFRALDTHDLRRGLRGQPANRTLACISRARHARSPQSPEHRILILINKPKKYQYF